MKIFKYIIVFLIISQAGLAQDKSDNENQKNDTTKSCNELKKEDLGAEHEAIEKLQEYEFNFVQTFETMFVQGVKKATFYSCENGNRYMVVETHRRDFLYENVTRRVWENFKNASSVNGFFYQYIRNNPKYSYP